MLMFVVLSAGMLTALTATMMSQAVPAFADTIIMTTVIRKNVKTIRTTTVTTATKPRR